MRQVSPKTGKSQGAALASKGHRPDHSGPDGLTHRHRAASGNSSPAAIPSATAECPRLAVRTLNQASLSSRAAAIATSTSATGQRRSRATALAARTIASARSRPARASPHCPDRGRPQRAAPGGWQRRAAIRRRRRRPARHRPRSVRRGRCHLVAHRVSRTRNHRGPGAGSDPRRTRSPVITQPADPALPVASLSHVVTRCGTRRSVCRLWHRGHQRSHVPVQRSGTG